jgi:uncharacterized protein (UPF0548 family)
MTRAIGWVQIHPSQKRLVVGQPLCTLARCFGFIWILNPCRIIAAPDSSSCFMRLNESKQSYSKSCVAFTTVDGHMLAGEERFRILWFPATDEVVMDMYSFSRPSNVLGLLALPYVRYVQRAFFRDQSKAMSLLLQANPQNVNTFFDTSMKYE